MAGNCCDVKCRNFYRRQYSTKSPLRLKAWCQVTRAGVLSTEFGCQHGKYSDPVCVVTPWRFVGGYLEEGHSRLLFYPVLPNGVFGIRGKRNVCFELNETCVADCSTAVFSVDRCSVSLQICPSFERRQRGAENSSNSNNSATDRWDATVWWAFLLLILFFSLSLLSFPPILPLFLLFLILTSNSSSSFPCPHSHLTLLFSLPFFSPPLLFHLFSLSSFSPPFPLYPSLLVIFLTSPSSSISSPCRHSHHLLFLFILLLSSFSSIPPPLPPIYLVHSLTSSSSSLPCSSCPFSHLPLLFHLFSLSTFSPPPPPLLVLFLTSPPLPPLLIAHILTPSSSSSSLSLFWPSLLHITPFSSSFLSFPSAPSFLPLRHNSPATPSHIPEPLYVTGTAMWTSDPHSCVCLIT